jgi:hypothetical protein
MLQISCCIIIDVLCRRWLAYWTTGHGTSKLSLEVVGDLNHRPPDHFIDLQQYEKPALVAWWLSLKAGV